MYMSWLLIHRRNGRIFPALLLLGSSLILLALFLPGGSTPARAAAITYAAALSGPAESPPNTSPGTGFTRVDFDPAAHTLRVQVGFAGLVAPTTASHIHACTATPGSGTAGVATQVPFFTGFPIGATSGTYDHTFTTLDAATYNPAFVTANGGTAASAEAVLATCLAAGRTYLNIHSTTFPGGEIRGFLLPAEASKDECKDGGYRRAIDPRTGEAFRNQGQCVSFVEAQQP
jgi:CHRD domain